MLITSKAKIIPYREITNKLKQLLLIFCLLTKAPLFECRENVKPLPRKF
jgi:hypothetical protein